MPDSVRCKDCGLLGARDLSNQQAREFTDHVYQTGKFRDATGREYLPQIVCCAGAKDLYAESEQCGSWQLIKATIERDRPCEQFVKRTVGRTPADHQDMVWQQLAIDAQNRLADIQSRIADVQAKQLEWQEMQAEKNDHFAKQIQALEETRHQEALKVGKSQVLGTNWQALGTVGAFLISLIALLIVVADKWAVWFPAK